MESQITIGQALRVAEKATKEGASSSYITVEQAHDVLDAAIALGIVKTTGNK